MPRGIDLGSDAQVGSDNWMRQAGRAAPSSSSSEAEESLPESAADTSIDMDMLPQLKAGGLLPPTCPAPIAPPKPAEIVGM